MLFDPAAFLVTSCTVINPQFYTGHSCNFLRVENETMAEKRPRPSLGFYKCISEFPAISRKRICERKPEVLGTFEAERIVAKKFVKGEPQYMVKWFNFCASENTWEPKDHLPLDLVEAFENPDPDPVRLEEARERIGLVFERGVKVPLQYEESIEIRHDVVSSCQS